MIADKQVIIIQDKNDSANFQTWQVNGSVNFVGAVNNYYEVPVILLDSGGVGSTNFDYDHEVFINISAASGTSGTSGTSGSDGTSGTSGVDGVSGTSGTSGSSGSDGTSGTSGVDGVSGTSGTSGTSGSSGISGVDGTDGSSGTSGVDGVSGTSGTSGSSGSSGDSLFALTGSVWATTNDIEITGSLNITSLLGITDSNVIMTDSSSLYLTSGSNIYVDGGIISGAYIYGDGSNLINIPASGVTGLQLNLISSGSNTASIDLDGLHINTNTSITGSLNVDGIITARQLNIDYVSSSIMYTSGSTKFGDTIDDTHEFTGSLFISGSVNISSGSLTIDGVSFSAMTSGTSGTSGSSGSDGTSGTSGSDGTSGTSGVDGVSGTSGTSGSSGSDGTSGTSGDSLFALTGSAWSTTNDVEITGSLDISGSITLNGQAIGTGKLDEVVFNNYTSSVTSSFAGTSSYAIYAENAVIVSGANKQLYVSSPSTTWSFIHNLHERYPVINVFDSNGYIVVPETIRSVNQDLIEVYFNTPETGHIVASVGGAGTSGTSGTSGSSGSDGTSGTSGSSGSDGTSGTSGSDGTSGTSGSDGSSGTSGTSGSSGSDGSSGTSGSSGSDGTSGTSGTSGSSGSDGTSGTSGSDGTSGTSGTSGSSGSDGSSGSSGDSLFAQTGSFWATTNDIQITGSLDITSQLGVVDSNVIMTDSSSFYLTSGSNFYMFNGKVDLTNSDLEINTGDLTVNNGTISGSFVGDGAGLYNIPSSGITGLNLDRIVSGNVSASLENGTLDINTDVNIDGILTAKELHIDYVTSSILYQSGSTKFGDTLDDTHDFTGSLRTTGSVTINGDLIVNGTTTLTATDPLRESLIISGAMAMMQAQIQSQIISASISMGGQVVISQQQNINVMDLGGF